MDNNTNNDESKIEQILGELVTELNIEDDAKKEEARKKMHEIIAAYRQKMPEAVAAAQPQAEQQAESTDLVPIKKEELQRITGCTQGLLTKYIAEGIRPFEIIEMHQIANKFDTKLTHVKNHLLDAGVNVDDMDAILEARDCLDFSIALDDRRNSTPYKPSLKALVRAYHMLNEDIDEFRHLISAAEEYQNLAFNTYAKFKTDKIHPNKFISLILNVYLNEGQRDAQLTIDLLEAQLREGKSITKILNEDSKCRKEDAEEALLDLEMDYYYE